MSGVKPVMTLAAESVTKRYGRSVVVDGASLTLAPGTLTALLGPSGAGKSTLLRILAGLEALDAGAVTLGGETVSSPGAMVPAERRRTGLIFQDYALFPHLSALENVAFGLTHLSKAEAGKRAAAWLDRLALGARAKAYPHQLSGGEQQRVAIARALAPDPDAILMDEPFSGLDPALESGVREAAMTALAEAGKPALLVTHDPAAAMAMADMLAVMRAGQIAQAGRPETVYAEPVDLDVARALGPINAMRRSDVPKGLLPAIEITDAGEWVGVREEAVVIGPDGPVRAQVVSVAFQGPFRRVKLKLDAAPSLPMLFALQPVSSPPVRIDEIVSIRFAPQGRFMFAGET
ncbi:MAG: ABC transporter ATP-binding protein [Pseudomonadota bacterium]